MSEPSASCCGPSLMISTFQESSCGTTEMARSVGQSLVPSISSLMAASSSSRVLAGFFKCASLSGRQNGTTAFGYPRERAPAGGVLPEDKARNSQPRSAASAPAKSRRRTRWTPGGLGHRWLGNPILQPSGSATAVPSASSPSGRAPAAQGAALGTMGLEARAAQTGIFAGPPWTNSSGTPASDPLGPAACGCRTSIRCVLCANTG